MAPLPCVRIWRSSCFMHVDAAQIDGSDPVGALGEVTVIPTMPALLKRHVKPAEGGDGALDHCGDLRLVRHVAGDADCPVARCGQFLGGGQKGIFVRVGEHGGCSECGEALRYGLADA